jgi:hypothetical protein
VVASRSARRWRAGAFNIDRSLPGNTLAGVNGNVSMKEKKLMKHIMSGKAILSMAMLYGIAAPGLPGRAADAAPKIPWKVSGELEEACSCRPACPCWFKSLPSRMTCDGAQMVFITKGHYGKVHLEGLAIAQFVQSPEHKSMFESFGNWNFDYVYIDEKADAQQRQALKELALHFFPLAAKAREYRYVPITRRIEGAEHITTIGPYGACSGHLIEGGYDGAPKVVNPPLADPTHRQFLQGQTTRLTYTDAGQKWQYENSNYMFNTFTVDNKQYEKHEAMMARKMGKM